MPPPQVNAFHHREFRVAVAKTGDTFVAVGFDGDDNEVARASGHSQEDVEAAIKATLNPLSNDFVGIEGAVNLFLRAFPGGFGSKFYADYETVDKAAAVQIVGEHLSFEKLSGAIEAGDCGAIASDARRAVNKTNIMSPFEKMALSDFLKSEERQRSFGMCLLDLLYGNDFSAAFEQTVDLLSSHGAAKWPIVTYFPFFRFPDRHMFLKPEIAQECAYRLGYELDYEPRPNMESYRSYLGLVDVIRDGIASLEPRDNIDIQSFMYVVGKEGYVRAAIAHREASDTAAGGS